MVSPIRPFDIGTIQMLIAQTVHHTIDNRLLIRILIESQSTTGVTSVTPMHSHLAHFPRPSAGFSSALPTNINEMKTLTQSSLAMQATVHSRSGDTAKVILSAFLPLRRHCLLAEPPTAILLRITFI